MAFGHRTVQPIGRSGCGWFALGLLLGPFDFILALVVRRKQKSPTERLDEEVPVLRTLIKSEAIKRRYCGAELSKENSQEGSA